MSAQKSKKFSLSDKVGMISKSNEGEFDESWLREEVSGEEEVLRMLEGDDGKSEVGAKEIFPPFFFGFFGMYPWRAFLCLISEPCSTVRNLQYIESLQTCDLSPVLTNKMH